MPGFSDNALTTLSHKLYVAREEADENGASGAPAAIVLATAGDFAQKPTASLDLQKKDLFIPHDNIGPGELIQNGLAFSFTGGAAADKTFTYDIFTWANENGPAKHTVNGTGILGTQAVVQYPHLPASADPAVNKFWADTLTVTWENHPKEVESTDTIGHNSVAEVWLDGTGLRYWFIQIADADGSTGTEAGDIAVFYRYF